MNRRIKLGPFNRVEGDLEVQLELDHGVVQHAYVNSTLFRGFEWLLAGRPVADALVYAPRICGICSVSQSTAAAFAIAKAAGITPPPSGIWAQNLMLACENAADHLTHFYLFFMPDFAHKHYAAAPWYVDIQARFAPMEGAILPKVLQARAQWLHIMGILGGHWPHTLAIQPGGTTHVLEQNQIQRLRLILKQFQRLLQTELCGGVALENILAAESIDALKEIVPPHSDLGRFLIMCDQLNLWTLGQTPGRMFSYGNYPTPEGHRVFPSGVWRNGEYGTLNTQQIAEDISHAKYEGTSGAPWQEKVAPAPHKETAYSFCKAPRLNGEVFECGALARQLMDRQPLMQVLMVQYGSVVATRMLGRLWELLRLPALMQSWLAQLTPRTDWNFPYDQKLGGQGLGLVEAARGGLLHWLEVDRGRIEKFEIIAPTTWNFSPRDAQGVPGALEQALEGVFVGDTPQDNPTVQHIVRSFDPCMVCTVH